MGKKIAIIHPDLGIGGAERLIVDVALGLQSKNHDVTIFTSHHDETRCFPETAKEGTVPVEVIGSWIPRSLFGYCHALMAYQRMMYCALWVCMRRGWNTIICDQISACVPMLRLLTRARVVFYCHYPDKLLTRKHSRWRSIYRYLLDSLEEFSTRMAHKIFVNSQFTGNVCKEQFKSLANRHLEVLYPCVNTSSLDLPCEPLTVSVLPKDKKFMFLSLNRYEMKKDILLAVQCFSRYKDLVPSTVWKQSHLVIAGGYDERLQENKDCLSELGQYVEALHIKPFVTFLCSVSESVKRSLLHECTALLYTPSNEHFGIVPIEAMYMGKPVIAANSGGPLETVIHGVTGFLEATRAGNFAQPMADIALSNDNLGGRLGDAGRQHVINMFSFESFASRLDSAVHNNVPAVCN